VAVHLYRRCLQPLPITKPDSRSMTSGSTSGQLSGSNDQTANAMQ
jgi:hypothetical protein